MTVQVPLPILITKEEKWFVASCPLLDIATQGKTEKEVKENIAGLIGECLNDPDNLVGAIFMGTWRIKTGISEKSAGITRLP